MCAESSPSPPLSFIVVIKSRIDSLAFQVELKNHEQNTQLLFADVFGPVPHLNDLPVTETLATIPLKNDMCFS